MNILERLIDGVITQSPEETIELAGEIAKGLPKEAIVTLDGDLGAGKTTFVKGLAKAMGIEDLITSPTFNIYNTYRRNENTLVHMDAYRLDPSEPTIDDLMIEDFLIPPYCLAIEWPSHLGALPWAPTLSLELTIESVGKHRIRAVKRHSD